MGRSKNEPKVASEPAKEALQPSTQAPHEEPSSSGERSETDQGAENTFVSQDDKPGDDFQSRYLQHITTEFADDLDKLRNANDFTDNSLSMLVDVLKQSGKVYTEEEQRILMGKEV